MYDELRRVGIPPKLSFLLIYLARCVKMLRVAISVHKVSPSTHTHKVTLSKNPGLRVGNSHDGSTRGILDSMVLFHVPVS
jgi:hypothetical protein